jgi:hypothetical protein
MAKASYRIVEGGMHDRFQQSRAKIQFVGGGFGNGKTTACVIKALRLCTEYPGSNGLIARSTYPKLNDTIRREFFKWCPQKWVKRAPTKDDNTCYLTNGTTVNFRYVAQRGKETEESKSNLLSATYDWMVVDQMEDPEFSHKDFMDLMGRLRGGTDYVGDDPTMPKTGPRWFMITSNPTRNWVYREMVRPLHQWQKGLYDPKLMCEVDDNGDALLDDGRPKPIIELFEGSTYENVDNVGQDYIKGMLSTYTGSMRRRFIYGEWGALTGLVYPQFDETIHILRHDDIERYLQELRLSGFRPSVLEGYDHGIAVPSCYLLSFVDDDMNVFITDGFYNPERQVKDAAEHIVSIRDQYEFDSSELVPIYADPQIFRRSGEGGRGVGTTVARLFAEAGIHVQRGANDIYGGIAKIQQYLTPVDKHEHPLNGQHPAPYLYVSDKLQWFVNEISEYYWKRTSSGDDLTDTPMDRNDHAMDALKYVLTPRPRLAKFVGKANEAPAYLKWHEIERETQAGRARHR